MEKKQYVKPSMEVYEMPGRPMLQNYSGGGLGYIPGQPDDEKQLA